MLALRDLSEGDAICPAGSGHRPNENGLGALTLEVVRFRK